MLLNFFPSNYFSLSVTKTCGNLKRHMTFFHRYFTTFCLVIVARGSASIHFRKQLILTIKNFFCPKDGRNDLRMSNPYWVNIQGEFKCFRLDTNTFSIFTNLWHLSYFFTISSMSALTVDQKYPL